MNIDDKTTLDLIADGGILYSEARGQIQSGDLLFLHHSFVASWYGIQIEAVQRFTGPLAHVAVFDRIIMGGEERLVVYESVVPKPRAVLVSATAEEGFFWMPVGHPITPEEREAIWTELGVNDYDKVGAVLAGLGHMPPNEDELPRRWCAKFAALHRKLSGVNLGPTHVPTEQAIEAMTHYNAPMRYVRMV